MLAGLVDQPDFGVLLAFKFDRRDKVGQLSATIPAVASVHRLPQAVEIGYLLFGARTRRREPLLHDLVVNLFEVALSINKVERVIVRRAQHIGNMTVCAAERHFADSCSLQFGIRIALRD